MESETHVPQNKPESEKQSHMFSLLCRIWGREIMKAETLGEEEGEEEEFAVCICENVNNELAVMYT